MDAGVGGQLALDLGQQRDGMSVLDVVDPLLDDVTVRDVGAEEEQIVGGQALGEIDYPVEVARLHDADGGTAAVAQFKLHWIRTIGLDLLGHRNLRRKLLWASAAVENTRKTPLTRASAILRSVAARPASVAAIKFSLRFGWHACQTLPT